MAKPGPASAMSFRQISELHAAVIRALPEMTGEQAQSWIENPRSLSKALREALINNTYKVTVDCTMSLAEMIQSGRYDWVHEAITSERIKIEGQGKIEVELILVHLDRDATTTEVEAELEKRGLRPARIEELLALGAQYPELQREFPIVALGSRCSLDVDVLVPVLGRYDHERNLRLDYCDNGWYGKYRFAAVRK